MSRFCRLASALSSLLNLIRRDLRSLRVIKAAPRSIQSLGLYTYPLLLSASGLMWMMTGCELTRPNISYDACEAGRALCSESCNGLDDDEDGSVDEGLSDACIIMVGRVLSRSGIEGGFGRALSSVRDIDGDGYSELLVSATRATDQLSKDDPRRGEVSLYLGTNSSPEWTVRSGGDFGHTLTSGSFVSGSDDVVWCSGAPTREERNGIGRVICLNFEGREINHYSSEGDFGAGLWLAAQSLPEGEQLVITEPQWGFEAHDAAGQPEGDLDRRGRLLSLEVKNEQLEVARSWVGNGVEQRVGERVIAIPDVDGDGIGEWLMTGYSSENTRQVWIVDGSIEGELRRLKRFSTSDDTNGYFGESLAWGRWDSSSDDILLAFGAPYISIEREEGPVSTGRVYFTNGSGDPRGTNSARLSPDELFGLGLSMVTVELGDEQLLVVAGPRLLRVISFEEGTPQVRQEFILPVGARPTLASSPELEPNGEVRVWIGLPELEEVHLLTLRPASEDSLAPENDTLN